MLMVHLGGSPGLLVMGGDTCSKGRGIEYTRWTFFHIYLM